jgi:cell division protein FtsN
MEQKKLLWIIFSVTLFLLVVVGIGIIWLYPSPQEQPVFTAQEEKPQEAGADFDPVEWVRSEQESLGLKEDDSEESDENFVVVYGDPGTGKAPKKSPLNTAKSRASEEPARPSYSEEETSPQDDAPAVSREVAAQVQAEKREEPAPEPQPATRRVRVTEYWIQTGSYSSRARADRIKEELDELGLSGRILSKDIDGSNYYRVRIGPYQEKSEADKFLNWVQQREQFKNSYISQVYRVKTVSR